MLHPSLKKHAKRLFLSRLFITGLLFLLQLFLLFAVGNLLPRLFLRILSLSLVLWVLSRPDDPAYQIDWILLLLLAPLPGCLFYLLFGNKRFGFNMKKQLKLYASARQQQEPHPCTDAMTRFPQLEHYLQSNGAALCSNCDAEYFSNGEALFDSLLVDLQSAKDIIYLEYFILAEGKLWDSILQLLEEKVLSGVDVYILYDDAGCLATLPEDFAQRMAQKGIHAAAFNPIHPRLNTFLNYRDHRKLCIIDGSIAYTGGANIADEYVNLIEKYGIWKDCGIRVQGSAVKNFLDLFCQLWQFSTGEVLNPPTPMAQHQSASGFLQPFGSDPMEQERLGRNAVLHCINHAETTLYIMTPYLILDYETLCSLQRSAQSGVDVRIITPHIPDKWYVHLVTRSFYLPLLNSGVRIFEFRPGFIHSKTILADDCAIISSINMDFRSFYLHFESAVALYEHPAIHSLQEDFLSTQEICLEITAETLRARPWYLRFFQTLLRIFAPLM